MLIVKLSNFQSNMYYIKQRSEKELHTIILKSVSEETTYIIAIGYGGGGVFEEFCGKFYYDEKQDGVVGYFSFYHQPDEWENQSSELEIIDMPYEPILDNDREILDQMLFDLYDQFIAYNEESEVYTLNDACFGIFEGDTAFSDDWDPEIVDFVSNKFWGLSMTFDW
ncbi:MAG: hypothetical protein RL263_458 [Bacteroidota bacterium]